MTDPHELERLRSRVAQLEEEVRTARLFEAAPYRSVVEDMSELVVRWRGDGVRMFVNDAYCRFFGRERAELVGSSFWPLVVEADREAVERRLTDLSPSRPLTIGLHRAYGPSGEVWMEWVDRALFAADGTVVEYQSVGRDITQRVELAARERELARADAASRVAAVVAHDLGNVLQILDDQVARLRDGSGEGDELDVIAEALITARGAIRHLAGAAYGRAPDPDDRVVVDAALARLSPVLRGLLTPGVRLETAYDAGPVEVALSPTCLDQIALNLVKNSVEALAGKGTIVVSTHRAAKPPADCQPPLRDGAPYIVVAVTDNGPGIADEVRTRLFEARATTKGEGRGLGLASVRAIVDQHAGAIAVETSALGTTIRVALPQLRTDR